MYQYGHVTVLDFFGNFWFRELSGYRLPLTKSVLLNIGIMRWVIEDFKNESEPQPKMFNKSIQVKYVEIAKSENSN